MDKFMANNVVVKIWNILYNIYDWRWNLLYPLGQHKLGLDALVSSSDLYQK